MANLKELLNATLLNAGNPGALAYMSLPFPITAPSPTVQGADDEDVYERNPIWHFENPTFSGAGVQVKNVSCRVRSMDYMTMRVLQLIEWGPVVLRSNELGDVSLPLTKEFLVTNRFSPMGVVLGSSSGYWQLKARIDQGFEMIFGYEIPLQQVSAKPTLTPLSLEDYKSDELMPTNDFSVVPADPGTGVRSTLRLPPLRVLIIVSLVCQGAI
jgi:hypothetical protein